MILPFEILGVHTLTSMHSGRSEPCATLEKSDTRCYFSLYHLVDMHVYRYVRILAPHPPPLKYTQ